MPRVLELLPQGGTLSEDSWERRHRGVLFILWIHAVVIPAYALYQGFSPFHTAFEGLIVPVASLVATVASFPRRVRTIAGAIGLLSASAVLVHLSGGLIELHFHFFVMVVVVSFYQDWLTFLVAIGYVFAHHGILGAIDPGSVYNHPAALAHPWKWAAVHAFFITGISFASVVNWRLNETYLARRREAEARLQEESRIVERLSEVGRMLAADLELDHVVQRVTDVATELTSAQFGAFFYNATDDTGVACRLYASSGAPAEAFADFPAPQGTGLLGLTLAGRAVVRLDDVTADAGTADAGTADAGDGMVPGHLPVRSYLAVPVVSRGTVLGGLFFGHPEAARFSGTDERIAAGIAAHAAVAVANAHLYETERQARQREEEARRRQSIVAEGSRRLLVCPLDVDAIAEELGALTVPGVADGFFIDVLEDGRRLRRVGSPLWMGVMDDSNGDHPGSPDLARTEHPAVRVLRSGRGELLLAGSDGLRHLVDDLGQVLISAAVVPLPGRVEPVGVMTLFTVSSEQRSSEQRELDGDDLDLVEELARRAAAAVENARLMAGHRAAAETLQHSLLPDRLPTIPGVELAARYVPGATGVEIGGDWYDVFVLLDGTVAFAMGDVVGRGVPAASLMGQLRNALRAYALDGHAPSEVLGLLSGLLEGLGTSEEMATLVYGVLDPETGTVRMANAGHPPPALRQADGSVAFIEGTSGFPLGAFPGSPYGEEVVTLQPGATLVLYTDGLVEARDLRLDDGLESLRRSLAAEMEIEELCDRVLSGATALRINSDDTAVLAVRCAALGDRLHFSLPAQPRILKSLRGVLRRWLHDGEASDEEAFDILVAVGEACSNVIRHARLNGASTFDLDMHRGDGDIQIVVRNEGQWRTGGRAGGGGYGLGIMGELMDEVEILDGPPETVVSMRRSLALRLPSRV